MVRHHPDRLVETDDITMMWDIPPSQCYRRSKPIVQTSVSEIRKQNTCLLIDISCPADGNISKKWTDT